MSEKAKPFVPPSSAPLIAGLSGGAVSTILLLPLDIIKVRLQVYEGDADTHKSSDAHHTRKRRLSTMRIVRGVIRHEGVAGLYQGLVPALIGSSVSWGGFFFVYEGFKKELRSYRALHSESEASYTLTPMENFTLACTSGGVMVGLTNPVWLIKLRMQLQMRKASQAMKTTVKPYDGMYDAARTIVREEGFRALYKGAGPALLLTSHGGVQFVVYEFLRKHFHYARAQRDSTEGQRSSVIDRLEKSAGYLTMGAVAKIVASTVTYPLQVLKARLQQRSEIVELTADGEVRVVKREYAGMLDSLKRIYVKEGFSGFFKGCVPNAIRVAPSAAVTFVVYESVLDFLSHSSS